MIRQLGTYIYKLRTIILSLTSNSKKHFNFLQFWKFFDQDFVDVIRNNGERATHLYPNDNYMAHLSIYDFASRFTKGLKVLDAGSGSGYGSSYLSKKGAEQVVGLELSVEAVEFSREYFGENRKLIYKQMDLENIAGFRNNEFDVIFSSNVLEHVPNVYSFFDKAVRLLKPQGMLILAVPPIQNDRKHIGSIISNLNNAYHINIWTMLQWENVLKNYFYEVKQYSHKPIKGTTFISTNRPEATSITVKDFSFDEIKGSNSDVLPTMTAVFLAYKPRKKVEIVNKELIDHSFYVNLPPPEIIYNTQGILACDILKSTNTHIGRLFKGIRFFQTFISNPENLCGIALCIATYRKKIHSTIMFSLFDDDGNVIRMVKQHTQEIPDNSFYPFFFQPISNSKDKKYIFCIETVDFADECITLWTNTSVKNNCAKNGEPYDGAICFKRCYRD